VITLFDLALTEKGDLVFKQNTQKENPLKISFIVGKAKAFKIGFQIEDCNRLTCSNGIKIGFDIDESRYSNSAIILNDYDAKIQAIKIRLQSAVGEIAGHPELGSMLELAKHLSLNSQKIQTQVVSIVKKAIADILPDANVVVKPSVINNGKGYDQKLIIYIYDNDILIFKYN
jgi:hypothetical protein